MVPRKELYTNNLRGLMTIGMVIGLVLAYNEVRPLWSPGQQWDYPLLSTGGAGIFAYCLLAISGLVLLFISIFSPGRMRPVFERIHDKTILRWILSAALFSFIAWFYLYSTWQTVLTGPWAQFLFAAGIACFIHAIFEPQYGLPFGWNDLALTFGLFLFPRVVQEIRIIFPNGLVPLATVLLGLILILILVALLYNDLGKRPAARLIRWRGQLSSIRRILILILLLTPFMIRYGIGAGFYILYPDIRFAMLLFALCVSSYLLCVDPDRLVSLESIGKSAAALVLVSAVTRSLLLVVDNPFSLSWSEGNRLYDYSLVFGQNLYDYEGVIPDPYSTPGRYGLWGILFLWQGLPIWVHRLWNVILLTLPSILLAWVLTRKLQSSVLKIGLFFWIATFFIVLAPLHPPFMIVAIIVAAFAFHPSPVVRGISLVAASLYAGVSRWTWVVAPGAWGALTDLFLYYPSRRGNWFQRLLPAVLMTVLGALPGFLLNIGNVFGYSTGDLSTAQQPLLWYRLLPNSTLGPGILLLMLLTTGPLIALLVYKLWARQWRLDAFQLLAVWGTLIGFLGAGLVISTKIGGGGDLHNLDMYIATLMFVAALGLTSHSQNLEIKRWPAWAMALVCVLAFLPAYPFTPFTQSANDDAWLDVPTNQETSNMLEAIRVEVADASQRGEVLFMDQRQLLTFGYVRDVAFVPEYEKKYMMDQALASNAVYFRPYYQDLARKRFALIVTEPLKLNLKGSEGVFSEENDLWVAWVSAPTLCFYEPIMTDKATGVQLLVPREEPIGCEKYLQLDSD